MDILPSFAFPAGRVLPGNQAQPRREVPAPPKALHRRGEGLDRHRGHRPDSRDAHQPHRLFVFAGSLTQFVLQPRDLLVEVGDLIEQQRPQLADRVRQPRVGVFDRLCQPPDISRSLRSDNAELGQMSP